MKVQQYDTKKIFCELHSPHEVLPVIPENDSHEHQMSLPRVTKKKNYVAQHL